MAKLVFHVDVNSAYLSWEAARRVANGEPDIRLIPAVIGGDREKRTGVVLAKSIPAKKFGIKTGEPIGMALRKCPDLFMAKPDFQLYEENSKKFMDICREYAPVVEKASIDKVLANAEIKTMINAFGCGFSEGYGNDFDISKLRYDKIIIMADADVDGAHISNLLLTLFYRFMPELIYEGHVYVAMPPLYKAIPSKGEEEYLYDDAALERYRKTHKGSFILQRYKGLGEMDAEQLWETTLDPKRRRLKRIEIEDGRMASDITELLMGNDVPPRKAFIYEHAHDAELDV